MFPDQPGGAAGGVLRVEEAHVAQHDAADLLIGAAVVQPTPVAADSGSHLSQVGAPVVGAEELPGARHGQGGPSAQEARAHDPVAVRVVGLEQERRSLGDCREPPAAARLPEVHLSGCPRAGTRTTPSPSPRRRRARGHRLASSWRRWRLPRTGERRCAAAIVLSRQLGSDHQRGVATMPPTHERG
jgi:hypothetical protein